jgi:CheY-like chemotaxis protein
MLKDSIDKIIKLEIGFNAWDFFINWSESSIHQVLLNLSINSNKAFKKRWHKSGDFIRISVDENRNGLMDIENFIDWDYLHISFKDNWPWMSEEVIKKAFDPYFTTWEKSWQGWVGLWLTSVYNIITSQHGGYIYINSKEWKWTTVHIYLPKWKPEKTIDLKKDKLIWGNETILIVDDEKQIQDISKTMLEMFGYKVLVAGDWEEALEIYTKKQNSIDLVIMDITMPIMWGIEALKLMKKTNDSVKVIIATGQSLYDIKDWDLKDAKNVISKPLAMDKYIKTVRGVLDDK